MGRESRVAAEADSDAKGLPHFLATRNHKKPPQRPVWKGKQGHGYPETWLAVVLHHHRQAPFAAQPRDTSDISNATIRVVTRLYEVTRLVMLK